MSPDRKIIFQQEGSRQFTFRNVADGKVLFSAEIELDTSVYKDPTFYFKFLPGDRAFLRGKSTAFLVDCREWKKLPLPIKNPDKWYSAMFTPDGTLIDDWTDPAGRALFVQYAIDQWVFSPDGRYFVQSNQLDGTNYLWDTGKNSQITLPKIKEYYISVSSLLFTPDSRELLICRSDGFPGNPSVFTVIDASTGKKIRQHSIGDASGIYHDPTLPSSFSPDGKRVLLPFYSSGNHTSIGTRVYDYAAWKLLYTIDGSHPCYVSDDVILVRKGNTFSFIDAADGKVLGAAGILPDGYVVAASDGRYESDRDGLQFMHWVSGTDVVPLDTLDRTFQRKGLFASLMSNAPDIVVPAKKETKEADKPVNVSRQLVGKIESAQGVNIIVRSSRAGDLISAGDRLFILVDGKKLMIEAVFPMMTVAKCRALNAAQSREFRKGMPVFK